MNANNLQPKCKADAKPPCCIAVWINIIMLIIGVCVSVTAGFYLFNQDETAIIKANQLLHNLTVTAFVFGILMIIVNATGIVVIWGKTSNSNDNCCDSCEKLASGKGWIVYLVMTLLMVLFTVGMCGVFTYMLVHNDPKSMHCPGISFDDSTICNRELCKDSTGKEMRISECPLDYYVISTVQPGSVLDTGSWKDVQNLFGMCGYYCDNGNCSLANGDESNKLIDAPAATTKVTTTAAGTPTTTTTAAGATAAGTGTTAAAGTTVANGGSTDGKIPNPNYNRFAFQLTGDYCTKDVKNKDDRRFAAPTGCVNCKPEFVQTGVAKYGVAAGASKTGLRDSLQFHFISFGIPMTIFLYVMLLVQLLNIACMVVITCMFQTKGNGNYMVKTRT